MRKEDIVENIKRISGVDTRKCMRCGKCTATCPSYAEMEYHPHQFVYFLETDRVDRLLNSDSIYKCLTCFACAERCPRGVEPAKLIEAVRLLQIREKGKNRMNAEDVADLIDENIPQQALVSAFRKYAK